METWLLEDEKSNRFEQLFESNQDNKKCFECGSKSTNWASVNNGVFLCLHCAGIHRSFGASISFIKSVEFDSWSDIQLKLMEKGGNTVLREFLTEFNVPLENPMDIKYKTRACYFYRDQLNCLARDTPVPEKPDVEKMNELFPLPENNSRSLYDTINTTQEETKENKTISSWFSSIGASLASTKEKINSKLNDIEFDKFKNEVKEKATLVKSNTINFAEKSYESVKNMVNKKQEKENPFLKKSKTDNLDEDKISNLEIIEEKAPIEPSAIEEEKIESNNEESKQEGAILIEPESQTQKEEDSKEKIMKNLKEMNGKMKEKVEEMKIGEKFDYFKSFAAEKWTSMMAKKKPNAGEAQVEEEKKEENEDKKENPSGNNEKIKGFLRSATQKTKEFGEDLESSTRDFRERAATSTKEGIDKLKNYFSSTSQKDEK